MITKNIAKFVVAVALTLAVLGGAGIAAEQIGYEVVQDVYAGPCTGSGGGGGC